uniref:BLTX786 n=1 Tax=Nephila pilipes TaxID=299642 RepID=A0A076L0Y5_NEPPI|nr:BLTX786 [Nephila pilipes]
MPGHSVAQFSQALRRMIRSYEHGSRRVTWAVRVARISHLTSI